MGGVMSSINEAFQKVERKIDEMHNEIVEFLSNMVQINSINPAYSGSETEKYLGGESEVNKFIKPVLESFGCKTEMWAELEKRGNLVGLLKGSGGVKSLILNGHVDVVPTGKPG
jgi:acetylornithine deacetylase